MKEIFLLYLCTRLDALNGVFAIGLALSIVSLVGFFVQWAANDPDDYLSEHMIESAKRSRIFALKGIKRSIAPACIFMVLFVLIPTKKDATIIAGGWVVSKAAQSEVAKEIGDKTWRIIQGKLDEQLKELGGGKP